MKIEIKNFGQNIKCESIEEAEKILTNQFIDIPVSVAFLAPKSKMKRVVFVTPTKEGIFDTYKNTLVNLENLIA